MKLFIKTLFASSMTLAAYAAQSSAPAPAMAAPADPNPSARFAQNIAKTSLSQVKLYGSNL